MSKQGPKLLSTKDGYAFAKFNGRKINFGRIDHPDTARRFDAFKGRWLENGRELTDDMLGPRAERPGAVTLDELAEMFLAHLKHRYPAEWQRNNLDRIEKALAPARKLFGPEPAENFKPKKLTEVRKAIINAGRLSREEINRRMTEIRRFIRWGVAQELLPGDRAEALKAVEPLRKDDYGVREGRKVRAVARDVVDATLPYLTKPLVALVELMWWCGARPSELFGLRPCDIDRSNAKLWVVRLEKHKTAWRGKQRELWFVPQAQAVLEPFLLRPATRALFRPEESAADAERRKRERRETPLYDSHLARLECERAERAREGRQRELGEMYDARTFNRAIARAIAAANRDRAEQGVQPLPHWHPYMLRHSAGTRIRRDHGLDIARLVLGHEKLSQTEDYAEIDIERARKVMEAAG